MDPNISRARDGAKTVIGHDKNGGCLPRRSLGEGGSIQRGEHAREIIVTGFYRGYRRWRTGGGPVLGIVRFAEPEERKCGNTISPQKISERFCRPRVPLSRLRRRRKCAKRFGNGNDCLRSKRFARENVPSRVAIAMSIQ